MSDAIPAPGTAAAAATGRRADAGLGVLIVEDSEDDALLLVRALEREGFAPAHVRVATADAMRAALARRPWDFVLADHHMPRFSAPAALQVLLESGRDVPFIIVSAVMPEESAVELMRLGARDFIPKQSPGRLAPAVRREVEGAEARRREREATEVKARLAAIVESADKAILAMTLDGTGAGRNRRRGGEPPSGHAVAFPRSLCASVRPAGAARRGQRSARRYRRLPVGVRRRPPRPPGSALRPLRRFLGDLSDREEVLIGPAARSVE